MNAEEKYLFDLMGFIVVKQALIARGSGRAQRAHRLLRPVAQSRGRSGAGVGQRPELHDGRRAAHVGRAVQACARAPDDAVVSQVARRCEVPLRPRLRDPHAAGQQAARAARRPHAVGPGAGLRVPRWRDDEWAHGPVLRAERRGPRRRRLRGRARGVTRRTSRFRNGSSRSRKPGRGFYACRCRPATRSSSAKRARMERGRGAPTTSGGACSTSTRPGTWRGRHRTRRRRTHPSSTTPSKCGGCSSSPMWHPGRTRMAPRFANPWCERASVNYDACGSYVAFAPNAVAAAL